MDKILLTYKGNDKISGIIEANRAQIQHDVLAVDIQSGELKGYKKEWNINGLQVS